MAKTLKHVPSTERLRQGKSFIVPMLELNTLDVAFWDDHFMGGAHPTSWYSSLVYQSTASGTAAAAAAISAGLVGGKLVLDAGTDNGGRSDLSLGLHFRGDLNAHCWWRAQVSAVTSEKFEFGFTDVVSGTDAGAVNVKATPSFNASDAVVLCFDTSHNTTLQLLGVAANVAATPITLNTTIAAATDYYFGIELRDSLARAHLLDATGKWLETTAWMTGAVTATTLLTPWAFQQNRSASQRTMTIDRLTVYSRSSTT